LDLYTWIPSGERRKERDISFSEFLRAHPDRSEDTIIPEKSKTEKAQGLSKK
jgi:hypothetical protein